MAQAIISSKECIVNCVSYFDACWYYGALSFNMFQNSMMSIFERHSFETGDTVLHKLDEEIVRDVTKDPVAQREKREVNREIR